jgi:hypothetical protein
VTRARHRHKRIIRSGPHPAGRPDNTTSVRRDDEAGRVCHWILEIRLTGPARDFGGFYEQLLGLG